MEQVLENPIRYTRDILTEQVLWLMRLRWVAAGGMVVAAIVSNYIFPVLISSVPIYICAGLLLLSNIFYFSIFPKRGPVRQSRDVLLGTIQIEVDLVILTAVLHFSGGVDNPFYLFYIFHVIIAAIMLPRSLSYLVGLTTISLFGLLAVCSLNGWSWLGYYPLRLSTTGGLWRNPVYVFGGFVAFACTVFLAQYLTRIIIVRLKTKEVEARQNNDVLTAVINAMAEGLIFVTDDNNVSICNPAARLWQNSIGVKTDSSFENFPTILTDHMKKLFSSCDMATENKNIIRLNFNTTGTEQRYIEVMSCPVVSIDGQKLGYVIVGQDLTEHKKLEKDLLARTEDVTAINEMLKMSRIKMAQREKMVTIGQMATGIAHEIGNPLASLSSVVQYLGRKLSKPEEKEQLSIIEHQVYRISNILKRMLTLARPVTFEYKWVDINDLIDNTLSLVKFDKRAQSISIKHIDNANLPMVWLNPQMFEQVILNIVINALDAMNAKKGQQEHVLEISGELKDGMIELRFSDTGIGMSPEVCRRAFESFFTTKEIGKGTGLGLYISYNLVTEIDGTISMESELGKGTMVTIRIPIRPKKNLISGEDAEAERDVQSVKQDN